MLLLLFDSEVVLDDLGVPFFAEGVAMANKQFRERTCNKRTKYLRVAVPVLTFLRYSRLDEGLDDILPRLVDGAVLIRVTLAAGGSRHVCGNIEVDALLILLVGFSWFVIFLVLSATLLSRAVVDVVQCLRSNKESVFKKTKLSYKFA